MEQIAEDVMTTEENKAIYREFLEEVFNKGRLDKLDEFLDPEYVFRDAPLGTPEGPEAIKQVVSMFRSAFPDLKITIEELVAEGDKVCARSTNAGHALGSSVWCPGNRESCNYEGSDHGPHIRRPTGRKLGEERHNGSYEPT